MSLMGLLPGRTPVLLMKFIAGAAFLIAATAGAAAERRVALVIGNAAYAEAGQLANALTDARALAQSLARLGFDVTRAENLDAKRFQAAIETFSAEAQGADVALLFYAGHALQFDEINYLMPVDAKLESEFAVKRQTFAAQDIVRAMEGAARLNLVFLDACRNNPLADRLHRSRVEGGRGSTVGRGLTRLSPEGRDTLIVFSAAPGTEAMDADAGGKRSPFAAGLLDHIDAPDVEIETMLKRVTKAVRDATGNKQAPERLSKLESEFYFRRSDVAMKEGRIRSFPTEGQTESGTGPPPPEPTPVIKIGRPFRDCPACPEMMPIPAGEFLMGSPGSEAGRSESEGPQRKVKLPRRLAVGVREVTVQEYADFVRETGGVADGGGCAVWTAYGHRFMKDRTFKSPSFSQLPTHPVVCVSWQAATTYTNWLTSRTKKKYRLLSEAEWEYAARAGSTTPYYFGSDQAKLCEYANAADGTSQFTWGNHLCADGAGVQTAVAGSYKPNGFGLFDMTGNAWEWVQDCATPDLKAIPENGEPARRGDCSRRMMRGGSWDNGPKDVRTAARGDYPLTAKDNIGFRVAREID